MVPVDKSSRGIQGPRRGVQHTLVSIDPTTCSFPNSGVSSQQSIVLLVEGGKRRLGSHSCARGDVPGWRSRREAEVRRHLGYLNSLIWKGKSVYPLGYRLDIEKIKSRNSLEKKAAGIAWVEGFFATISQSRDHCRCHIVQAFHRMQECRPPMDQLDITSI